MPKGLSYADAVKLLGGQGPLATAIDNLLGGVLSVATLGGSGLALSLFDAKSEMVRLGGLLTAGINDSVRGLRRHDRNQRLLAAHAVLVVSCFFEALDEHLARSGDSTDLGPTGLGPTDLGPADQLDLIGATPAHSVVYRLITSHIPMPSPDRSYARLLAELEDWYGRRALEMSLGGRRSPARATALYDAAHRRLAGEVPEFAIWIGKLEDRATARGLERLESLLLTATAGRDPGEHRAALARVHRAELDRPVLGGDPGGPVLPTLGQAYLDPRFRVKASGPAARPAAEQWWDTDVRTDIHTFFATYLTTGGATEAPLLLLGQPGAGKSSLTRILAARLPARDFLVARVPLRDVPAEAEIQDQVEHALRAAIGETVPWAALAREAGDALPVILLDGFDELLQATGVHHSNYLERVAEFQRREATMGRPVAVVVTSRIAVADWARLPEGGLVVRLEPFDGEQIERWAGIWNAANQGRLPSPLDTRMLRRLHELAEQPLLLLMLALYGAAGHPLHEDAGSFDTGELYERLLARFAAREVERVYAGQSAGRTEELIEEELVRLSVVAFGMFNRNRLWVGERELDDDLAALRLTPSRTAAAAPGFRSPLSAAQEMIGRFFFIQRAQARQDDKILQTYEFLHATFGEYLIARLLVQTLREVAAHDALGHRGLRLRREPEGDLLAALLGFTPLTVRNTVLTFVAGLITDDERDALRAALVRRASRAVTDPSPAPGDYRPVGKRIDHAMATYSFNLVLLVLAAGGELRASELFTETRDPAYWMRGTALQWRAAVPDGMWLEALENLTVRRDWHEGRRDMVLSRGGGSVSLPDPDWSHRVSPDDDRRAGYVSDFLLMPALTSMTMSNNLSDDTMLHALGPVLTEMPSLISTFVPHEPLVPPTESVAHTLLRLWLTSALSADAAELNRVYQRAAKAVAAVDRKRDAEGAAAVLLHSLASDIGRLHPDEVLPIVDRIAARVTAATAPAALRCLLTPELAGQGGRRAELLADFFVRSLPAAPDEVLTATLRELLDTLAAGQLLASALALVKQPSLLMRVQELLPAHSAPADVLRATWFRDWADPPA